MKKISFAVMALMMIAMATGCISKSGHRSLTCMQGSCAQAPENAAECGCEGCGAVAPKQVAAQPQAPCETCPAMAPRPAATVAYPYYTTRGPRDFLAKNPPSIGP